MHFYCLLTVTRQLDPWISWSVSRWLLGDPLPLFRSVFPKERLFITVRWSSTQPVMRLGWVKIWSGWKCGPSEIMDWVKIWDYWKYWLRENMVWVKMRSKWNYGPSENMGLLKILARWKIWLSEGSPVKFGQSFPNMSGLGGWAARLEGDPIEYFSGVNIFQSWLSFRSEYFFRLSFAQWNIVYSHAVLL